MHTIRRFARPVVGALFALSLVIAPMRAAAATGDETADGWRRVIAYAICALTAGLASDSITLMRAGGSCVTLWITEAN